MIRWNKSFEKLALKKPSNLSIHLEFTTKSKYLAFSQISFFPIDCKKKSFELMKKVSKNENGFNFFSFFMGDILHLYSKQLVVI